MTLFHLMLVAIIQGATEFLPISSSGHLVLLPSLTSLADQGQAIDVAAHVGSLAAVILYFWRDVRVALGGLTRIVRGKVDTQGAFLCLCLIVGTIPIILVGLFINVTGLADSLRSITVIGWMMLIFGIVLYWADQKGSAERVASQWTLKHALTMGLMQCLALIPGTSRSGITITGARLLGYDRSEAARLSMLMSIPTILASATLLSIDITPTPGVLQDIAIVVGFSFVAALAALVLMMKLLQAVSYTPYVIYRIGLGIVLLWIGYT